MTTTEIANQVVDQWQNAPPPIAGTVDKEADLAKRIAACLDEYTGQSYRAGLMFGRKEVVEFLSLRIDAANESDKKKQEEESARKELEKQQAGFEQMVRGVRR